MGALLEQFSVGLFAWQGILFIILLLLLRKFAWKPILGAVNTREKSIQESLELAEKTKKEMAELQASNEELLKEARAERDNMLKEAKKTADTMVAEAKDEAKKEGDKLIGAAKEAIEIEKRAAIAEVKNLVAAVSLEVAEKLLRKELSSKGAQKELVEALIGETNHN